MTYRGGAPIGEEENLLRPDCLGYVVELEGRIVGALTALKMTCNIDGTHLPCAGVAAVGVVPEARRLGVGSALMTESLRLFREDGFVFASLYPFRETYYSRFGYVTCGGRVRVTMPTTRFPRSKVDLPVRMLSGSEYEQVRACFDKFCDRYNGSSRRSPEVWADTDPYYVVGDPIEGFIQIKLGGDFWSPLNTADLVWTTERSYYALLDVLHGLAINRSEASWYEPTDGPYLQVLDQGVRTQVERLLMYRTLDIEKALSAKKPTAKGSVILDVHDPILPEISGRWAVEFSPDQVSVLRSNTGGYLIDQRRLTQALLGQPAFATLHDDGFLPHFPPLEALLPGRRVYCPDFY